jgi:hypothetical protein
MHKVGLTAASLGEPGYEERETIVNGLSVAAKVALRLLFVNPTFLLLTIKLTLFRIRSGVLPTFPNWRFDKRK